MNKHRKKTTPRFFIMLTIVCMVIACTIFISQEKKLADIREQTAALQTEYDALSSEKQRVEYMIEYAHSTDYMLQFARERLGYVQPGDIKFDIEGLD